MRLRIGTRGSRLAMWQAERVAALVQANGDEPELVIVRTTGDRRIDVPLSEIGGKGMFVKELEEALLEERIDLAVHSLKDVPSIMPAGMLLAAFPEREDPRDAWLQINGTAAEDLPEGAVVATGSPRREAQVRARWPHLRTAGIRGNVDSRLRSLQEGRSHAMILAMAGLKRLDLAREFRVPLEPGQMIPAAGQGILAIETLAAREEVVERMRSINEPRIEREALAERSVLEQFGDRLDCHSAIGVHARHDGSELEILAYAGSVNGNASARVEKKSHGSEWHALASEVHGELVRQGAMEILELGAGS